MTIETLTIPDSLRAQYLGDGVQTLFPVPFPIFGEGWHVGAIIYTGDDANPEEQVLVHGIDYTVQELTGGGELTTTVPVPSGHVLTLFLVLPIRQPRDFDNQGRLDAEELEKGLDYLTVLVGQNAAGIDRALKVPISSPQTSDELMDEILEARDKAIAAQKIAEDAKNDSCQCRDESCQCRDEACQCKDDACQCAADAQQSADAAAQSAVDAAHNAEIEVQTIINQILADGTIPLVTPIQRGLAPEGSQEGEVLMRKGGVVGWNEPEGGGTVDSVDEILPDPTTKNVQLRYRMTQQEFDALPSPKPPGRYIIYDGGGGTGGGDSGLPFSSQVLYAHDEKPAGSQGGSFTTGAWRTRDLNTVQTNTIPGASLSNNQITLPAGTYDIFAVLPAYAVNTHIGKLFSVTDNADLVMGSGEYSAGAGGAQTSSIVMGRFTLVTESVLELQHRCETSNTFGRAAGNLGTPVTYTKVQIRRVL